MPALFAAAAVILVLAQDSGGSMLRVIAWSLVLICLLMVGFFAISKLRQWMRDDDMPAPGIGFTLSDLRQLHKQGQMTDEEFERAKSKIVGGAKAMAAKLPDPLARDRGGAKGRPPAAPPGPPAVG
jgi:uncharacterized membrane protein